MPIKTVISNINAIEESNTLMTPVQFQKFSKILFSNLAESLLINLPKLTDEYNQEC